MAYTRVADGTYSGDSGVQLYVEYYLVGQSVANNTSTVHVQLVAMNLSSGYGSWSGVADSVAELYINGGTNESKTTTFDFRTTYQQNVFFSKDITISHDSDGKGSFTLGGKHTTSNTIGYASCSGSVTLPTISREATLQNVSNFTDEENPVFTFSNPGGYYMYFWLEFDPYSGGTGTFITRTVNKAVNTSYTFTLTDSERDKLRAHCTSSNKLTVRCGIKTSINGSYTGTTHVDRQMTIVNANPSEPGITLSDTNATTLALTGDATKVVKGYSDLKATVSTKSTAKKSASMVKYKFTNANLSTSVTDGDSEIAVTYASVTDASVTVSAVDSRGNTTSVTQAATVVDYSPPTVDTLSFTRSNGGIGSAVTLTYSSDVWPGDFGAASNAVTAVTYKYRLAGTTDWTAGTVTITASASGSVAIGDFDAAATYEVMLTVSDRVTTVSASITVGPGRPAMKIDADGVTFRSDGLFVEDANGNRQTIQLFLYPVGITIATFDPTNPGTYWGGTWERTGEGKVMLGASDDYPAESTGGEATHTLTKSEMPAHSHRPSKTSGYFHCYIGSGGTDGFTTGSSGKAYTSTEEVGGGAAHNNMMPYISVYTWRRTA